SKYHTIVARETITYHALKEVFGKGKGKPVLYCCPDPAFTLEKRELPLPDGFAQGNTVGINVSPMIQENESIPGITLENYREMIQFIIDHTDMQIALIPHVVWERNDDRKPVHELYETFKGTGRVVEIGDGTCEELKGFISRCRLFVGARTHATIAAYSSLVPTLVVGYSVKARGIAWDLFKEEEHYVIPVQSLKTAGDLTEGFRWLLDHEKEIREHLEAVMPSYREQAYFTGREVDRLWEEFSQPQKI
ncbi:MAG: polysaccharide pyruvyl transferase family protein, partial [Lachnospiraceae bacterium]|nr:polysaccharide pyruvyl transferase family protein [Lachnospiraceae bacterium]